MWFKSRKQGRTGRERTAQDERIVVQDAHPAMIDRDTFERRKAQAEARRFDVHTSPGHRVNYLLSRLIVCDVCGAHFCGRRLLQKERNGTTTEKFAYYCGGYLNKGTAVCASLPIPKH